MRSPKDNLDIPGLVETVQFNCDIADARFAGDDTLCIYLLKMREFFRWSAGADSDGPIDRELLGDWIMQKESMWDQIEEQKYKTITIGSREFDRFDNKGINNILNPLGLIYSGGLGRRSRPIFFLAHLEATEKTANCKVLISGEELARNMTAPPGMSHRGCIYVRRDALRRYLAAMVEEWKWAKRDNAMAAVLSHYGFENAPGEALETLLDCEQENLILHEIGERIAEDMIGEGWQLVIEDIENPVQELKVRAVRDNLADCMTSLPAFLALKDRISLDFYYANMTPLRREMFPSFCEAYRIAKSHGDYRNLTRVVAQGRKHWLSVSRQLVSSRDQKPEHAPGAESKSVDELLQHSVF
jgi:hypothetical protein